MSKFRRLYSVIAFYASLMIFIFAYTFIGGFVLALLAALTGSPAMVVLGQIALAILPATPLGSKIASLSVYTMTQAALMTYDNVSLAYTRVRFFVSDLFAKKDTVVHYVEWEVVI